MVGNGLDRSAKKDSRKVDFLRLTAEKTDEGQTLSN